MTRRLADSGTPSQSHAAPQRAYAARSVAALLPAVTRASFRRRSPASARIFAEWPQLVGPAMAGRASPRKLAGGTLTLACTGPTALEVQHQATQLIERINSQLGTQVVARLAFVRGAAAVQPPAPPSPAVRGRDVLAGKTLPDGPVGDALRALAGVLR